MVTFTKCHYGLKNYLTAVIARLLTFPIVLLSNYWQTKTLSVKRIN